MSDPAGADPVLSSSPSAVASHRAIHWVHLAISILLSAASQIFLKLGAGDHGNSSGFFGLGSEWVWLGIIAMVVSLLSWLQALRTVSLSVAFTLAGATHVLVPVGSWMWLGETISVMRGGGILLVLIGVTVSAKPATRVEERL